MKAHGWLCPQNHWVVTKDKNKGVVPGQQCAHGHRPLSYRGLIDTETGPGGGPQVAADLKRQGYHTPSVRTVGEEHTLPLKPKKPAKRTAKKKP